MLTGSPKPAWHLTQDPGERERERKDTEKKSPVSVSYMLSRWFVLDSRIDIFFILFLFVVFGEIIC